MAVERRLFRDKSIWEVYVRTDPAVLREKVDPTDPSSAVHAGGSARTVTLLLATESGLTISAFKAGGHAHEQQVVADVAGVLAGYFPSAQPMTFQVYYGEAHLHATATYSGGKLDYRVLDQL